ncbi:MAG: tRNA-intron lyase [Desulfurococcales archaeon]|nr:tRNA-intron lyase [Desulfurococcales archaeon]
MDEKIKGYLHGKSVIVPDTIQSKKLYTHGFYGKPLGVDKPGKTEWSAPLILSLLEALYLTEKGILEVYDAEQDSMIGPDCLKALLSNREKTLYMAYRDLRNRKLIVRSGLKFGAPFAVYRFGPGIDHAPFIVEVKEKDEVFDPIDIVRAGRLGHSVKKTYVVALVSESNVSYIIFKWFKP